MRAVALVQLLGEGHLHEAAYVAPELAVAVADAEKMHLRQPLDVGLEDVGVLVHLVRVVRVEADASGEGELPDAVLAFLVGLLLRRRWLLRLALSLLVGL